MHYQESVFAFFKLPTMVSSACRSLKLSPKLWFLFFLNPYSRVCVHVFSLFSHVTLLPWKHCISTLVVPAARWTFPTQSFFNSLNMLQIVEVLVTMLVLGFLQRMRVRTQQDKGTLIYWLRQNTKTPLIRLIWITQFWYWMIRQSLKRLSHQNMRVNMVTLSMSITRWLPRAGRWVAVNISFFWLHFEIFWWHLTARRQHSRLLSKQREDEPEHAWSSRRWDCFELHRLHAASFLLEGC